MKVKDVMTGSVHTVSPEQTLREAAQEMESIDAGVMPVCDDHRLVGILTDRDVTVRATAVGLDPNTAHVREVMSGDVIFCSEDEDVRKVAGVMEERQIRRMPVLDREMRLAGILSLGDLAVRAHNTKLAGEVLEHVSENLAASRSG